MAIFIIVIYGCLKNTKILLNYIKLGFIDNGIVMITQKKITFIAHFNPSIAAVIIPPA